MFHSLIVISFLNILILQEKYGYAEKTVISGINSLPF